MNSPPTRTASASARTCCSGSSTRPRAASTGPGTLSFWWKVSSELDSDRLRFYLDGTEQWRISGETDWPAPLPNSDINAN